MPEVNQVHVDAALTNLAVGYRNPAFISDVIAPVVGVRKQFDRYFIYDSEREGFRASDDRRAPGAAANEVDFALSTDSYFCDDHALTSVIPDEERDNADPPIQPNIDRTEFLRDKIDLNKEIELAGVLTDATLITQSETLSGTSQWSDLTNSDPHPHGLRSAARGRRRPIDYLRRRALRRADRRTRRARDPWHRIRHRTGAVDPEPQAQRGTGARRAIAPLPDCQRGR